MSYLKYHVVIYSYSYFLLFLFYKNLLYNNVTRDRSKFIYMLNVLPEGGLCYMIIPFWNLKVTYFKNADST